MNTYHFKNPYNDETLIVRFEKANYQFGGGMALQMLYWDTEYEYYAPWATVTVNLPETKHCKENCAFLDTNNCVGVAEFLEENDLATPTGRYGQSGYCTYPEYDFSKLIAELG